MSTKQTEALKLALEALTDRGQRHPDDYKELKNDAITAIREALAEQPAQQQAYEQANPLGGPAKVFDAMANAIRSGDDYRAVLRQYGYAEAQQQKPVAHSIVAGALFDFMGWLTSRNERLVLSSTENAAPAADAIKDFAHMRNLNIDDAKVRDWQEHLTSQPAQQQGPVAKVCHDLDGRIGWNPNLTELPAEGTELYISPPASKPWVGLTGEEMLDMARTFGAQPWPPGSCVAFGQMVEAKLREKNA